MVTGARRTLAPVGIGILFGVAAAVASGRMVATLLYEVSPNDGWVLVIIPLFVAAVAVFTAAVPARRASRVDPITALRAE